MKIPAYYMVLLFLPFAVLGKTFSVDNCVRVDVEGSFEVDAVRDGQKEFSVQLDVAKTPSTVTNMTCSEGDTSRTLAVHFKVCDNSSSSSNGGGAAALDWTVVFSSSDDKRVLMDQLVKFTPSSLFGNDTLSDEVVSLTDVGNTELSLTNESFTCRAEKSIPYEDASGVAYNFSVSQIIRDFRVQAFNLNGTSFSPAEECSDDLQNQTTSATTDVTTASSANSTEPASSTEPATTASTAEPTTSPAPEQNTYVVLNQFGNVSCIVLRGDITFTDIAYNVTEGGQKMAGPISIPRINSTSGYTVVSGTCATGNSSSSSSSEQMVIPFHKNWTLTLTFALGSGDGVRWGVGTNKDDEYSLRDIEFRYTLTPDYFPNASNPGALQIAKAENLTDFLQGSTKEGSYKCSSQVTQTLDTGVKVETTHLQYKAFNGDDDVSFNDGKVRECPADEGTDHTVAIAVGATLGGLIVIMLIAYLIGRRNRRQKMGYDSF